MAQVKGFKIRLLRDWLGNKKGSVLKLQEAYGNGLILRGTAEKVTETVEVTSNVGNLVPEGEVVNPEVEIRKMVLAPPKDKKKGIKLTFLKK